MQDTSTHAARAALRCITCRLRKVKCSGGSAPCENCQRLNLDCAFPRPGERNRRSITLVRPSESITEAGTARRRTTAACHGCRVHKIKCNGQRPQCQRCQRQNVDCVYPHDNFRDGLRGRRPQSPRQSYSHSAHVAAGASSSMEQNNTIANQAMTLDTTTSKRLLSKDFIAQHIDAYFIHIYHIPGYNFFHRPSMLEDLYNDRLSPILSTAICAIVSGYVNRSKVGKELSVQWAATVDSYIFTNLNNLTLLNLQIMMLSLFQNFSYRQFGRTWLILGMAARLALGIQLNKGILPDTGNESIALQECNKRLAWSVFIQDKLYSGGIDEFVAMPKYWMHLTLPLNEDDFLHERYHQTASLNSDSGALPSDGVGISGCTVILMGLRHDILQATKAVISGNSSTPSATDTTLIAPLTGLQTKMQRFYAALPPDLALTDRNIFVHSSSPQFIGYISLHTWYLQASIDLYRVCFPGILRESALSTLLANEPPDFVVQWQHLAVSFAVKLASTWKLLLDLKASSVLQFPGDMAPLDPASCVSIYQVTKVLLIARRFQIYCGLIDPLTYTPVTLDNDRVEILCQSNLAYIQDLASIAPIAAVVQQDVRAIVRNGIGPMTAEGNIPNIGEEVPVTSQIQKDHVLSRYNVLAMGIAASRGNPSSPDGPQPSPPAPSQLQGSGTSRGSASRLHQHESAIDSTAGLGSNAQSPIIPDNFTNHDRYQASYSSEQSHHRSFGLSTSTPTCNATSHGSENQQDSQHLAFWTLGSNEWPLEYIVPESQTNMSAELDWFLANPLLNEQ